MNADYLITAHETDCDCHDENADFAFAVIQECLDELSRQDLIMEARCKFDGLLTGGEVVSICICHDGTVDVNVKVPNFLKLPLDVLIAPNQENRQLLDAVLKTIYYQNEVNRVAQMKDCDNNHASGIRE